jgi:hypothetical protein
MKWFNLTTECKGNKQFKQNLLVHVIQNYNIYSNLYIKDTQGNQKVCPLSAVRRTALDLSIFSTSPDLVRMSSTCNRFKFEQDMHDIKGAKNVKKKTKDKTGEKVLLSNSEINNAWRK